MIYQAEVYEAAMVDYFEQACDRIPVDLMPGDPSHDEVLDTEFLEMISAEAKAWIETFDPST